MQTLTIKTTGGAQREFMIEAMPPVASGRRHYILTGARGASYIATPYIDEPDYFHIIKWGGSAPFPGVILTDTDGELRQVA